MNYQTGIQNTRLEAKTTPEQMPPESKKEIISGQKKALLMDRNLRVSAADRAVPDTI